MGIKVQAVTKDKKNLLGRRVKESLTEGSGMGSGQYKREVYNKKGALVKSKTVQSAGGNTSVTKKNSAGTTRTVTKKTAKPTMLQKRVDKSLEKRVNKSMGKK